MKSEAEVRAKLNELRALIGSSDPKWDKQTIWAKIFALEWVLEK